MKLVMLESPYAGPMRVVNVEYARACLRDCLQRGEAPLASHLLYTQPNVLNDDVAEERELGIAAGMAWAERAELVVVYQDLGISEGMKYGIAMAEQSNRPVEYRHLGENWWRL